CSDFAHHHAAGGCLSGSLVTGDERSADVLASRSHALRGRCGSAGHQWACQKDAALRCFVLTPGPGGYGPAPVRRLHRLHRYASHTALTSSVALLVMMVVWLAASWYILDM